MKGAGLIPPGGLIKRLCFLSDVEYEDLRYRILDISDKNEPTLCPYLHWELVDSTESRNANMFKISVKRPRGVFKNDPLWRLIPHGAVVTLGQTLHLAVERRYEVQIIVPDCYAISIQRNLKDPRYDEIREVELPDPRPRRRHSSDQISKTVYERAG